MLEDDFEGVDDYLFHPSQLDAVGYAGSEEYRAAYKNAIALCRKTVAHEVVEKMKAYLEEHPIDVE